jgi:DHA1 family bicyclomycin/chloramphenicol resistance-like MFS transporter
MHKTQTAERAPSAAMASTTDFPLGPRELVAMMAALMALNALAIDAILPAFPQIGTAFDVADPNSRQYIISSYLMGMGLGSLFYGPIGDRFGRKPVLLASVALYVVFGLACAFAPDFDTLLILRFAQGFSAAAMGVLVVSVIRDIFSGDRMARFMSIIFIVFMAVPVIAPTVGQLILYFAEWRFIFILLTVMGSAVGVWVYVRLPETLKPENVIPIRIDTIGSTWFKVVFNRTGFGHVAAGGLLMGAMFGFLNSSQQIFSEVFGAQEIFPYAFAAVAGAMAVSNWFNSRIVERFGARRVSQSALLAFLVFSGLQIGAALLPGEPMVLFLVIVALNMAMVGFIGANFGSIAMEPFAKMAGAASSFQMAFRTVLGAGIGAFVGQAFDGTTLPMAVGFLTCGLAALAVIFWAERGKLFNRPGTCPNAPM